MIIDDEPDARRVLCSLLSDNCPDIIIHAEADSVTSGIPRIRASHPDLVFLDIHMEDGSGFDVLDKFPDPPFLVIFITAFSDFAVKAFRYSAIDYLLKPINSQLLIEAVRKVREKIPGQQFSQQINHLMQLASSKSFERIVLPTTEGLIFVNIADIRRVEADGSYSTVFTKNNEQFVVSKSIKEFENLLPTPPFCRTHQSHLVNIRYIRKYLREDGGYALMDDGSKIIVARRRRDHFIKTISSHAV